MGEMKNVYKTLEENLKGRNNSDDLSRDEKKIGEWILEK
jgi:hypothetical protein